MPLNLSAGGDGEFIPYLKFSAKAGRFYVRSQGSMQDVEVEKPRLLIDMANIKTGWIYYQEGGPPEKLWDASLTVAAPRPAGPRKFKRGFELLVLGGDQLPGIGKLGLREFSSTAGAVIGAILKMYDTYETGSHSNPGKLPFFANRSVLPIQGQYGTNYEPVFELVSWVERAKAPEFDMHLAANTGELPADPASFTSVGATFHAPLPGSKVMPLTQPQRPVGGMGASVVLDDSVPFAPSRI